MLSDYLNKIKEELDKVCKKFVFQEVERGQDTSKQIYLEDVFHAANCALWLLEQDEFRALIKGDWRDPEVVRDLLRKAGCVPSCDLVQVLKLLDVAMLEERKQLLEEMAQPSAQRSILPPVLIDPKQCGLKH